MNRFWFRRLCRQPYTINSIQLHSIFKWIQFETHAVNSIKFLSNETKYGKR